MSGEIAADPDPAIPGAEIAARQVGAIARLTPWMVGANVVNACATLFVLHVSHVVTAATLAWAAIVLTLSAYVLGRWWLRRDKPFPATIRPRTITKLCWNAALLGCVWAYPGLAILPDAPAPTQAFLVALCAGMVSGGAITLYPVPTAAALYAVIIAGAHLIGFARTGETVFFGYVAVALCFFFVISQSVVRHREVFVSEFETRRKLDARNAQVTELLAATRDEAGRQMRESEAKLAQVAKLEAIGRLTAGIAHDFNNLLAAIMGNVELLQTVTDDPQSKAMLAEALDATRRGADLTRHLLAFGRKATLAPEAVDPRAAIEGMARLLGRTLPATVALEKALDPDAPTIRVDPSQFSSAVLNLAINARDAMPDGGTLTIATRRVDVGAHDALAGGEAALKPGRYVAVEVGDTGIGVPAEVIDHVFEPFFTTKAVGAGTGLGLAIVYGFARQSGGLAEIESRPGAGTNVRLLFPEWGGPVGRDAPAEEPGAMPGGSERILVVEDAADVRAAICGLLRALGFQTLAAPDGAAALGILRSGAAIDLMLADMVMPGTPQGAELARIVRADFPAIRVVLMSGYPKDGACDAADGDPGQAILAKPVTMDVLARTLRRTLDGR